MSIVLPSYRLSKTSLAKLDGVHPDLVAIVKKAITLSSVDFCVIEGLRNKERQKVLYMKGASQTMRSRHLTGHAVDLGAWIEGQVDWSWPLYYRIAKAMKDAANSLKISIEWGGDWKKFKDGPHFQLPWVFYPLEKEQ